MTDSVFARYAKQAWPYRFTGTLHIERIAGGVPTDPKVAEGWLRTKLAPSDDLLRQMVAEVMVERGVGADEAVGLVDANRHLNGFKRDPEHGLYIEGRQLKAAIKEAASVAASVGKIPSGPSYGTTQWKKGLKGFVPEHIQVVEDRLYLGVNEPSSIEQRFVHTHNGSSIAYEETVQDAKVDFTVHTDYKFGDKWWAMVWLTGQEQGIGATRSQGYGRYTVTRWDVL